MGKLETVQLTRVRKFALKVLSEAIMQTSWSKLIFSFP